jgi:hypothetical protein
MPARVRLSAPPLPQLVVPVIPAIGMRSTGAPLDHVLLLLGAFLGLAAWSWWWLQVVLEKDELVLRRWGRREIRWAEVQAVTAESELGTARVRVWLSGGRAVTLPVPTTTFGLGRRRFERQYHQIGRWWLAHRGADWAPEVR